MSNINNNYIEDYIRGIIPKNNGLLASMEEYAKRNHIPIIHPEVAQLLRVLIKIKKPKKILEIGTAIGYSTIIMAENLESLGTITTIERRDDMIDLALDNIKKAGFMNKITILKGEANEILCNLDEIYDFIFLDAAKGKYMEFFNSCINNLVTDGIIVSDNVLFKGMVANDDLVVRRKKTIVKRMREYLNFICNTKGLVSSVIPIGDGVALTYKEGNK